MRDLDQPTIAYRYTGDYLGNNHLGFGAFIDKTFRSKSARAERNSDTIGRAYDGKLYVEIAGRWHEIPHEQLSEIELSDGAIDRTYAYDNIDVTGDGKPENIRSTGYVTTHASTAGYDKTSYALDGEVLSINRTIRYTNAGGDQLLLNPVGRSHQGSASRD